MYAIYGNIYHQYTPNVSIYIYIYHTWILWVCFNQLTNNIRKAIPTNAIPLGATSPEASGSVRSAWWPAKNGGPHHLNHAQKPLINLIIKAEDSKSKVM